MQSASERSAVLQQRVRSLLQAEQGCVRECDIGYWDCNKAEGLSWSVHMFELFDVKPKAEKIDVDADFFSAVHPEDLSDLQALLKAATREGGRFTTQYRVVWKDNTVLRIKACGGQFVNSDGSISLVGTCVNITKLQQLRQADLQQMQHEEALCRMVAKCGGSSAATSIAAWDGSTDIWPWTLGNCFAQVSNLAQPSLSIACRDEECALLIVCYLPWMHCTCIAAEAYATINMYFYCTTYTGVIRASAHWFTDDSW
jgi:PAS fold